MGAHRQRRYRRDGEVAVAWHPSAYGRGVREADRRHAPWSPPITAWLTARRMPMPADTPGTTRRCEAGARWRRPRPGRVVGRMPVVSLLDRGPTGRHPVDSADDLVAAQGIWPRPPPGSGMARRSVPLTHPRQHRGVLDSHRLQIL